jgi:two-component system, cell cycle sensor histidine kinase and response regulator CckA
LIIAMVGLTVFLFWYFAIRTPIPQRPLRIGFEPNPPVQVRTSSGYAGLAVEVVSEAARRANLPLQWVETGTSSDEAFRRGLVDLWPIMADLPDRRDRVHFTRPWLHTQHTLILRSDSPAPNRNFDGRIAIFKLPLHLRLAHSEFPNAQLVEFEDSRDVIGEVCSGRALGGFLEDRAALRALLDKPAECASVGLQLHGLPALTVSIGTASTFEAAPAADKLRKEIDSQFMDGTFAATVAKYSFYGLDDTWTTYDLIRGAERARLFAWGIGALGIALTVTIWLATSLRQRKRSETALRSSEERLRLATKATNDAIWDFDLKAGTVSWNDTYSGLYGRPDTADSLQFWIDRIHPEDRTRTVDGFQAVIAEGASSWIAEYRFRRVNGEWAYVYDRAYIARDASGVASRVIGAMQDLTEQKKSEAALRESEERFRRVFEDGPLGLALVGHDYRFEKVNSALCRMVDYDNGELIQLSFVDITHPDDVQTDVYLAEQLFKREIPFYRIQKRYVKKGGEIIWINLTASMILGPNGEPLHGLAMIEDITEIKRTQEEALFRQKLESVGTLAGGIAHDFNNLLGAIQAQAELAITEMDAGTSCREELKLICDVATRGSEIVRQLMIYSGHDKIKDSVEPLDQVDLSALVEEMLVLLKISISKRAVLKSDLDQNLPPMPGEASRIRQIVMNLVINASEALGQKDGVIRVRTSRSTLSHGSAATGLQYLAPGDYLVLEVSDTGCGMSEEVQSKAFDPFFTTKFAGRGLGLAVVHGIVRDHGGAVNLISTPSEGTTFEVFLPSVGERNRSPQGAQSSIKEDPPQSRTVLVVEDEEALRLAVCKMLRKRGFAVVEAVDGNSAVESIRSYADGIDVMLLDMTLPGISSPEVLAEARRLRPNLKPILTSAHSKEAIHASYAGLPNERFLRKPYRIDELVSLLRDAS